MKRFFPLILALLFFSCDSNNPEPDPVALEVQTATNVEADPATGRDVNTGRIISNNLYTLFDLDANEIVLSSSNTDMAARRQDSTATVWDIGFKGTTIIFNGGTSGPGNGAAQLLTEAFSDVLEAPADGYITDGSNTSCPMIQTPVGPVPGSAYAICTGSDNGWYNYNSSTLIILPIAGRTIVLQTADGKYAKMRILSYYKDNPASPDANSSLDRYYTFEYILQPDGGRNFETTTGEQ